MSSQPNDESRFDARVLEHRMRRGVLSEEEYQKYLDALPDEADEAAETQTRFSDPYYKRHYGPDATGDED